jgi:predicted flap endonuclease-1-like 5' DNA nuclease
MNNLTSIQGLSIAAEDRLRRAGITSCNQLAATSPQEICEVLGYLAQGSNIERWIAHAEALAREHALLASF